MDKKIWTIGHSTLSIDDFTAILHSFKIETLVDVRRFPGSKKFPQFNKDNLNISLSGEGIAICILKVLEAGVKWSKALKIRPGDWLHFRDMPITWLPKSLKIP